MPEVMDIGLTYRPVTRAESTSAETALLTALTRLHADIRGLRRLPPTPSGDPTPVQDLFVLYSTSTEFSFPLPGDLALHWQDTFPGPMRAPHIYTQATSETSTTVSVIRRLLRLRSRDERIDGLTPERRSLYDEILALRERIGPVDFDIAQALRELREDG